MIDLDPHFSFHFANAYEENDGSVLIGLLFELSYSLIIVGDQIPFVVRS